MKLSPFLSGVRAGGDLGNNVSIFVYVEQVRLEFQAVGVVRDFSTKKGY